MAVRVDAHKVVYAAIPKAACSSIKAGLALIDPKVDVPLDTMMSDNTVIHSIYQTRRFRVPRWSQFGDDWWRFCVVRDPLKLLLSVYTDRVQGRTELRNSRLIRRQTYLSADPDPDFFFQNLEAYMHSASVVRHHAMAAHKYIGNNLKQSYERVFKVSEIPQLIDQLSERCGMSVVIPKANASKKALDFDSLKPKTQNCLKAFLKDEYDFLGDYYKSPFA